MIAQRRPTIIIVAEEVEGQALAALIMNAMRGTLKVAAIKAPFYGNERRDTLSDLLPRYRCYFYYKRIWR